ncbi:glycosyltransferase family 1 protein [Favolaschia claudopus]|uniref:Glycosyltransferase family 1 protein n=1 Tax=Favolaschia claudopus TaxID=2862362 RepID=A0AAV9ZHW3_9AGAR
MPPRNRHPPTSTSSPSTTSSPGTSPPAPPPATGLTKRQRQALRINRSAAPATSTSATSTPAFHPASLPHEDAQEERERERASPSKYPTPLPDEDEDEYEEGPGHGVPVGTLVDVEPSSPRRAEPPPASARGPAQQQPRQRQQQRRETSPPAAPPRPHRETSPPLSAAAIPTRHPPPPQADTHPPRASSSPHQRREETLEGQEGQERHERRVSSGHRRVPEAPRPPPAPAPTRALSALSALRAVAASTSTQAYAYAYGSPSSPKGPSSFAAGGRRNGEERMGREDGGHGDRDGDDEKGERVVQARWDEVRVRGGVGSFHSKPRSRRTTTTTRRLLTLTYTTGVQVWDATHLGGVSEVVNLNLPLSPSQGDGHGEMYGPVLSAAILPPLRGGKLGVAGDGDGEIELGVLTPHALYVYALHAGRISARVGFPLALAASGGKRERGSGRRGQEYGYGVSREDAVVVSGVPYGFEVGEEVIVVTTHSPPALIVLARPSLRVLHVFPAAELAAVYPPPSSSTSPTHSSSTGTSPPYGSPPRAFSSTSPYNTSPNSPLTPIPVSALHNRLLAFLSPPPLASPSLGHASPPLVGGSGSSIGDGVASWGRSIGRFFSRSAPAAASVFAGTLPSLASAAGVSGAGGGSGNGGGGIGTNGGGSWVRVVDLAGRDVPRDVYVFEAGRAPLGGLSFTADGTKLIAVRRDGLGASMYALRPTPSPLRSLHPSQDASAPTPMYALKRGRTGAVVEAVHAAQDGRYVALATRRRTVHVFAVNSYGGRADVRSHVGEKVWDAAPLLDGVGATAAGEERPTEVHALVRLRLPAVPQPKEGEPAPVLPAPLAIAFIPASASSAASTALRPTTPVSPSSNSGGGPGGGRARGAQDVLVFDPLDGMLGLRRVAVGVEAPYANVEVPLGPISVSLPAAAVSRLSMSASPPSYAQQQQRGAGGGGTGVDSVAGDLVGKESVVATWKLGRRSGWPEIRRAEEGEGDVVPAEGRHVKEDWLAQAELSTFSNVRRVLPRPIYLCHQFAFYTLGEDYHALLRRYQLAIGGVKIEVRREVEVSAFSFDPGASASGEAFVEGYGNSSSSPRAIRRRSRVVSSSFEEPLSSALAAGGHYRDARPPPVLPMLPNGSPASSSAFRMPARAVAGLGDNVAEGIGRLRREMRHQRQKQQARSPPNRTGGDDIEASVPLEFDEEDEDFTVAPKPEDDDTYLRIHADRGEDDDAMSVTASRLGEESVPASVSTPATSTHPEDEQLRTDATTETNIATSTTAIIDADGEGEWAGWATEDRQAVEEAERFDDISVVGFLDEEQAAMQAEEARRQGAKRGSRGKKGRN